MYFYIFSIVFWLFFLFGGARVPPSGHCIKLIVIQLTNSIVHLNYLLSYLQFLHRNHLCGYSYSYYIADFQYSQLLNQNSWEKSCGTLFFKSPTSMHHSRLNTSVCFCMIRTLKHLDAWLHFIYFLLKVVGVLWRKTQILKIGPVTKSLIVFVKFRWTGSSLNIKFDFWRWVNIACMLPHCPLILLQVDTYRAFK